MATADYWDTHGKDRDFTHPLNYAWLDKHVPKRAKILDMGCGYGRLTEELRQREGYEVVGYDTSKVLINRGKKLYPKADLRWGPDGPLPFEDGTFDLVLLIGVLTCHVEDATVKALLAKVSRVLKPTGKVYVTDLLMQRDKRNQDRYNASEGKFSHFGTFEMADGGTFRHYPEFAIRQFFANYEFLEWEDVDLKTMGGHPAKGFQLISGIR